MQIPDDIASLRAALIAQREYTLGLYADLPPALWQPACVPYLPIINPPLWELAHIAWFQENFALRVPVQIETGVKPASCLSAADALFDSAKIAHATRWTSAYPARVACMDYMRETLAQTLAALERSVEKDRHFFQLVLAHEDMHGEALAMTLTSLKLPLPATVPKRRPLAEPARDMAFGGGAIVLGASERCFRFDNEVPPQPVEVKPFAMSSQPVAAQDFLRFAESDTYRVDRFWSKPGLAWRDAQRATYSQSADHHAAMHVSFYEAEAYCSSVNRRLPTEAEWEFAATHSSKFLASTGHVWEWTASVFAPRPGFVRGVYQEYSEPWFGNHQVLKGASFVTHPRMSYPQYRNFYTPDRRDMFCGFRTCAVG
jgi:gamma-glutamyl hercynylcysteine S-oxide synthase